MIKPRELCKQCYTNFFTSAYTDWNFIPTYIWIRLQYFISTGEWINFNNPEGYAQKIQWIKAFYRNPLLIRCSDKYTVRQYIVDKGYENILPELLGIYKSAKEIDFSKLPRSFVLKLSTGSGNNLFVSDKNKLDKSYVVSTFDKSLNAKQKTSSGETHYLHSKPVILCEPYLSSQGTLPADYKFYCSNGEVLAINYGPKRDVKNDCKMYIVDMQFRDISSKRTLDGITFVPPKHLDEMIKISANLSKDFPFVRVDFYENEQGFYFSELTFTPSGGTGKYLSKEANRWIGQKINLPNEYYSKSGKWVYKSNCLI